MDSATPDTGPTQPDSQILVCLESIATAINGEFEPRTSLADFSIVLQPLVPHDRLGIGYLGEERRTYSVFAEHGEPGFLAPTDRYTTDLERPAHFPVADLPVAEVFEGNVLCASDLRTDPSFVGHRDLKTVALRSAIVVPVLIGSRVIGELGAYSRAAGTYGPVHVERMRTVGRLIGQLLLLRGHRSDRLGRHQRPDRHVSHGDAEAAAPHPHRRRRAPGGP